MENWKSVGLKEREYDLLAEKKKALESKLGKSVPWGDYLVILSEPFVAADTGELGKGAAKVATVSTKAPAPVSEISGQQFVEILKDLVKSPEFRDLIKRVVEQEIYKAVKSAIQEYRKRNPEAVESAIQKYWERNPEGGIGSVSRALTKRK